METKDIAIIFAHLYIFGNFFQTDMYTRIVMLIMATLYGIFFIIEAWREYQYRLLELKYARKKCSLKQ